MGKGYVEVCPKGIDKGIMAERAVDIATVRQLGSIGLPTRTSSLVLDSHRLV